MKQFRNENISRGKYTKLKIKGQIKEKCDILQNNNKSMIFMHNLEIINNRSIVKTALHCIKIAFEKNIFYQNICRRTCNVLII